MGQKGVQDLALKHEKLVRQLFSKNIELQENFGGEIKISVPRKALGFLVGAGKKPLKITCLTIKLQKNH